MTSPRSRPLMIFDGDCRFCRRWIEQWQKWTGDRVEYLPYQELKGDQFPEIPREKFSEAVYLIEVDGRISHGADAVFRSRCYRRSGPKNGWGWRLYQASPLFRKLSEWAYGVVARHRFFFSTLTRWCLPKGKGGKNHRSPTVDQNRPTVNK